MGLLQNNSLEVTLPLPTCLFSSWGFPGLSGLEKGTGEGGIWLHSRSLLITFAEERVKATIARFRKEKLTNGVGRLQWQNMLQASLPRSHPSPIHTNMQLKVTTFTTFSLLTLFIGFV